MADTVIFFYGDHEVKDEILWFGVNASEDDDLYKKANHEAAATATAALTYIPTNTEEEEEESSKRKGMIRPSCGGNPLPVNLPIGGLGLRIEPSAIFRGVSLKSSTCLALGPYIYCIGGFAPISRPYRSPRLHLDRVLRFNSRSPSSTCLETCTPMNVGRVHPNIAAVDGKLFVLGGALEKEYQNVHEYFDPSTNKWEFLPPIPIEYNVSSCPIAVFPEHKMFVLCTTRCLLCFDVNDWSWTRMDGGEFLSRRITGIRGVKIHACQKKPAVAGLTIYWFCPHYLYVHAFDLLENKWFSAPVKNLKMEGDLDGIECFPTLLHLHDELFCLVWDDCNLHAETKLTQIRCTILQISLREWTLSVLVKSTQTYLLDNFHLVDAVLVDGALEENIKSSTDGRRKKKKKRSSTNGRMEENIKPVKRQL